MKIVQTLLSRIPSGATWLQVIILSIVLSLALFILGCYIMDFIKFYKELQEEGQDNENIR